MFVHSFTNTIEYFDDLWSKVIKMKNSKLLLKYILTLCIGCIVGFLFLLISNVLINKKLQNNIFIASKALEKEGDYWNISQGIRTSQLDNYMDSLMLCTAGNDENFDNIIDRTIYNFRNQIAGQDKTKCLSLFNPDNSNVKEEIETVTYEWYWQGYLIFLRPFLLIWDYITLRQVNSLLILFEIVLISILLYQKNNYLAVIPFLISVSFLNIGAVGLSIQFSTIFHLACIVSIVILHKKIHDIYYYFFCIGMCTSYFDFLTYPLISLTMPLLFYLITYKTNCNSIKFTILNSINWFIGYVSMWISKWLISSIITGENHFIKGWERIRFRSSDLLPNGGIVTQQQLIVEMWKYFKEGPFMQLLCVFVLIELFLIVREKPLFIKKNIYISISCLIIGIFPIIWYSFTKNHTMIHTFFTFRTSAMSFLAFGSVLIPIIKKIHQ